MAAVYRGGPSGRYTRSWSLIPTAAGGIVGGGDGDGDGTMILYKVRRRKHRKSYCLGHRFTPGVILSAAKV